MTFFTCLLFFLKSIEEYTVYEQSIIFSTKIKIIFPQYQFYFSSFF